MGVPEILGLLAAAAALLVALRWVSTCLKYRGQRLITCPENHRPAGVRVDARHAAGSALGHAPHLRVSECSRWPERAGCGQQCLEQIAAAPEGCLVRNILLKWYVGKSCRLCGRLIGDIVYGAAQPAVLTTDKGSVEWSQIPAEQLPDVLSAAELVCFACHMAGKMVREHPELVITRSAEAFHPPPARKDLSS
jgi:hypothetical protein